MPQTDLTEATVSRSRTTHSWDDDEKEITSRRSIQQSHTTDLDLEDPARKPLFVVHEPDHITQFPNRWSRYRYLMREASAEFLGTMILIIFGNGVNLQVVLSSSSKVTASPKGDYLSIAFGWAIGTALGIWVGGGFSGGHINPAVTLSQAIFRKFPWRKVPIYIISQVAGAFTGALLMYATYFHALDAFEGVGVRTVPPSATATAGLFATYAQTYETSVSCFFDEFLATAILLLVVFAVTDRKNGPPPAGLVPLAIFILVLGEGACLGMNTAYAINPARDLGPRLLTWIFYGKGVWNYRHQYWLWTPIIAPILGGLAGAGIYDIFLFTGDESIINAPNKLAREHHAHAERSARDKIPAGLDSV